MFELLDALEDELDAAPTGIKARITTLENTINTTSTGLVDRVETVEETINDEDDGLAATKAIADAAKATADTAL